MKKVKKAEIATFLTLGLVLVGAVLSLLSGVMVSKQKNIVSNPRADYDTGMPGSQLSPPQRTPTKTPTLSPTKTTPTPTTSTNYNCPKPIPSPDKACCFCQNGKVRVYASSKARRNNCMATPCTTDYYGNAYGAESWGYCNDDGTGYEEVCKPVTTKGEETTPTPTPPKPKAYASSICNDNSNCQPGYSCILIPSGYGVKYCASPTPTPPTLAAGVGTKAPVSSTLTPTPRICYETNKINFPKIQQNSMGFNHLNETLFTIEKNTKLLCDSFYPLNDPSIRVFIYCLNNDSSCHYRCFYNNERYDCWGIGNIGTQINYGPDDTLLYLINNLNKDIVIKSIVGFKRYLLPGVKRFDYVNLNIYLSNRGFYVKEITGDAACGHVGGIKERIVIDTIIYCDANNENDCTTLSTPIEYDCESGGTSFLYILE